MRSFLSFFVVRVLLSVWVLSPGGWHCGSLRSVWSGSGVCAWGGHVASSDLRPADAWELVRFWSSRSGPRF